MLIQKHRPKEKEIIKVLYNDYSQEEINHEFEKFYLDNPTVIKETVELDIHIEYGEYHLCFRGYRPKTDAELEIEEKLLEFNKEIRRKQYEKLKKEFEN